MTASRFRICENAVFAEMGDGSGVVLDLKTKSYYTLNVTGVYAWRQLAASPLSVDELVLGISGEFDVTEDQARTDIAAVLESLTAFGLVEPTSS